jgi:hydrogenase nickel incorporation protein HypA/HybF
MEHTGVHEGTLTTQLVESVLKEAGERKAKKVIEVRLEIGEFTFLNPEQVRFWYEITTKDTIMEGSRLVISEREGTVQCSQCGYEGDFKYVDDPALHVSVPSLKCPRCDAPAKIVEGKDCIIKHVKMII